MSNIASSNFSAHQHSSNTQRSVQKHSGGTCKGHNSSSKISNARSIQDSNTFSRTDIKKSNKVSDLNDDKYLEVHFEDALEVNTKNNSVVASNNPKQQVSRNTKRINDAVCAISQKKSSDPLKPTGNMRKQAYQKSGTYGGSKNNKSNNQYCDEDLDDVYEKYNPANTQPGHRFARVTAYADPDNSDLEDDDASDYYY